MTIDHVGIILFPDIKVLRIIGRLCYPLIAFLIAYGCTKTRNISRYFLRLMMFAVWMQIAWAALGFINPALKPEFNNIFFTLAFGVLAIWIIRHLRQGSPVASGADKVFFVGFSCIMAVIVCAFAGVLQVDYGMPGVMIIILFWAMMQIKTHKTIDKFIMPVLVLVAFNVLYMAMSGWGAQWWSMLSVIFIWLFIDKKRRAHWAEKYSFYIYYPLHFVILFIVAFA